MNIFIYGLNYYPEPTGTGKYTGEMAAWLAKLGHAVDVIVAPPHYPEWDIQDEYKGKKWFKEVIEGVNVYRTPLYVPEANNISGKTRIIMESSYSFNSLRWWLPRFFNRRYDVVIAVCPPMQVGVLPLFYSALRNVPWVFHIQDLQVDAAFRLGILNEGLAGKILYKIENFLLSKATRVSTITEAMRKRIISKGIDESKTLLFPNWSDIDFITPQSKYNKIREDLGVNDEDVLAMYAGNMGEKQGLELILHAADRLKKKKNIKFAMVGNGATRSRLENMKNDMSLSNITFLPVQPLEKLPELLAAADIHLVVQKREAADIVMPSKLTNILAAGRPSIATADPGTTLYEVITANNCGVVVVPEQVEPLATAIDSLAGNGDLRTLMGQNARRYAEQYIDKEQVLKAFENALISIVEKRV